MSGQTSQPNLNSIVAALKNTPRDTGLDLDALNQCADYWETVRGWYEPFDTSPKSGTAEVYLHEMPGGQFTNLKEQAESLGLGPKWPEIARMYRDVNLAFGDIVKVTPSSKVVGDMALFLISHDMTIQQFLNLQPGHNVSIPHSVVDMFEGSLGEPEGGWPEHVKQIVLNGRPARAGRPGEHLAPADFNAVGEKVAAEIGRQPGSDEVLSYLMYPDVFLKFAKARAAYGELDVLPTPQFFFGMQKGEEIAVDIEPGKTLVVKFLAVSEPHPDGTRTVFFEINGQPREVDVRDKSLRSSVAARVKADPLNPGNVGAPLPGLVTAVAVSAGAAVKKGDKLLVIEAMKMQSTVYVPMDGMVTKLTAHIGMQVEAKDLLAIIE